MNCNRISKPIRVVLHGGLGNQLFQLFYAVNLSAHRSNCTILLHTELLGKYSTAREFELSDLVSDVSNVLVEPIGNFCSFRFPKILNKFTKKEKAIRVPFFGYLVDGYFQSKSNYLGFERSQIKLLLSDWRGRLGIECDNSNNHRELVHIRLGDFFNSSQESQDYVREKLLKLPKDIDVMSNEEGIVNKVIVQLGRSDHTKVIATKNDNSWDVFKKMCAYDVLYTNGSTLAFWAACISCAKLYTTNNEHALLYEYFFRI